jgi:hypothetical protein
MKQFLYVFAALFLHYSALFGQSVTLPAEVKGARGAWIIVAPSKVDGGIPKWQYDPALQEVDLSSLFPAELTKSMRGKVFTSQVDGKFWVRAWNAKGDVPSDMATCWLIVGTPTPIPPGPEPPAPPGPSPIPLAGNRVFIVYETSMALPAMQQSILTGKAMRDYLESKCVQEPSGEKGYRIWDKDANAMNAPKHWQDILAKPRPSIPWLVISTGASGWEGPLPPNTTDTIALMEKYFK